MNRPKMDRMLVLVVLIIAGALSWSTAAPAGEPVLEGSHLEAAKGVALDVASDSHENAALVASKKSALVASGEKDTDPPEKAALVASKEVGSDPPEEEALEATEKPDAPRKPRLDVLRKRELYGLVNASRKAASVVSRVAALHASRKARGKRAGRQHDMICNNESCCINETSAGFGLEFRESPHRFIGGRVFKDESKEEPVFITIIKPDAKTCVDCLPDNICDYIKSTVFRGDEVAEDVPECHQGGFITARPNLTTKPFRCSYSANGKHTHWSGMAKLYILPADKCQALPPHVFGANMIKYDHDLFKVTYRCRDSAKTVESTCKGNNWPTPKCPGPGPILCEDREQCFQPDYCNASQHWMENCELKCGSCDLAKPNIKKDPDSDFFKCIDGPSSKVLKGAQTEWHFDGKITSGDTFRSAGVTSGSLVCRKKKNGVVSKWSDAWKKTPARVTAVPIPSFPTRRPSQGSDGATDVPTTADRSTSSLALTIILPLITCAWM